MLGARGAIDLVDESRLVEERRELRSPRTPRHPNEVTPLIGESRSCDFRKDQGSDDDDDDNGDDYDTIGSSMSCDPREVTLLMDDDDDDSGSGQSGGGTGVPHRGRERSRAIRPGDLNVRSRTKDKDNDDADTGSSQSGDQNDNKKRKWPKVPRVPKNIRKMGKGLRLKRIRLPRVPGRADANIRECNEFTAPLMAASKLGHLEEVERLVEIGHDVNIREPDDTTPLMYAAEYGHPR